MAEIEIVTKSTSEIAGKLELKIQQVVPVRAQLMKKGMIYSPE